MTTISTDAIHVAVRERYARLATQGPAGAATCCEPEADTTNCCYEETAVEHLPAEVTDLSLGCGDPIALASLQPGQVVLDLGSGAGLDCFLAAERVGPDGQVIGVDMTPAMLERARRNQAKLGLSNVEFRRGQIEALPIDDHSVDVILSNCVINLSPDKAAVFREAFRVLRPGGRLAVSDIVTLGPLPPAVREDMDAWSACVAGAEPVPTLVSLLAAAGFADISVRNRAEPERELSAVGTHTSPAQVFSAHIAARKPD